MQSADKTPPKLLAAGQNPAGTALVEEAEENKSSSSSSISDGSNGGNGSKAAAAAANRYVDYNFEL
jgi:hypothetical protein